MMAGIRAGERGRKVLIVEKNNLFGKKLLITGNGRCNLTNIKPVEEFIAKFSKTGNFLRNSFARYFSDDLISFFEKNGLEFTEEEDGCVFPSVGNAGDVLRILEKTLNQYGVKKIFGHSVKQILIEDNVLRGVELDSSDVYLSSRILISTGGLSYPQTGSSGDGFIFAKSLGHSVIPARPALVPIEINNSFVKSLQGISLQNIGLAVFSSGKKVSDSKGDLVFTHYGISGPVVFSVSASVCDELEKGREVRVSVNIFPEKTEEEVLSKYLSEYKSASNKTVKNIISKFMPSSVAAVFLKEYAVSPDKIANQINAQERGKIISALRDFRMDVKSVRPVSEAIITRGGVSIKEINPKTMESKVVRGLFFAGEVIDVDAMTGGYNLQAAFSTGWVAGNNL